MAATRLLLDTHVFLWWRANDPALPTDVRDVIAGADAVFVSAASAWEAGIKVALGKLEIPDSFSAGVDESGFDKLPITFSHAEMAPTLPPHHRDPFDRLLIAQAQIEADPRDARSPIGAVHALDPLELSARADPV